ncbi:conjugal transfer protein TraF [Azospirillum sp. sgz302134]
MRRRFLPGTALALCILGAPPVLAGGASFYTHQVEGDRFIDRHEEGWFWYKQDPEPEPEPEEEAPPPPAETPPPEAAPPPAAPVPDAKPEPPMFSAAWLREKLPQQLEKAIDSPTRENVELYYLMQRVAMDKSNAFSDMAERVVTGDKVLDENNRRPIASFAANQVNKQSGDNADRQLADLAATSGLWFFYRSDCPYCHLQVQVLKALERLTNLKVMAIAVDGLPLPENAYPNYVRDTGQAAMLGVDMVPALYLVHPPDGVQPLAQGVVAYDDLRKRILVAATRAGWISEESFATTRPLATTATITSVEPPDDASIANDPQRLIGYLREKIRR